MPTLQTGKKETFLADLHTEIQNRTGLTTQSFLAPEHFWWHCALGS